MNKQIVARSSEISPGLSGSGLIPLLQRIYSSRGVAATEELDNSLKGLLPYHTLRDIGPAVAEISRSIETGERILVVGDFDCDGATSSALAVSALRGLGAAWASYLVPNRFEYGYGLSPEIVAVAAEQSPQLLITVDNGISSVEGVRAAKAAGMRVVVTDHHLPGDALPDADALVNPNQHGCEFSGKNTCGVGVIFYVMTAVCRELQQRGWFERQQLAVPNMAEFLDLVALGTVADVVPLDRNNRILVDQGLKRIRAGRCRPGIAALAEIGGRTLSKLVAADLGFAIAPRLNAAGRLEDMSIGIECLLSQNPDEARRLALQLDELNQDRKQIEQQMQSQALSILANMQLGSGSDAELPFGITLFEPDWHEGVIGILASRIKERLHRPVIAFAQAEGGQVKGSARSIPGLHIRDTLDAIAARHPELLNKFGGHAMAAGMSLDRQHFERFQQAFDEEVRRRLTAEQLLARIETDGALSVAEMSLETAQQLRNGGPWGQLFPEPLFEGVFEIVQQRIVGERHLKLMLAEAGNPQGFCVDAIAFNVDLDIWPSDAPQLRLAYKLDLNEFRGKVSLQLLVDYLEPVWP